MDLNTAQLLGLEYAIVIMGLFLGYKCISLRKDNMDYFMRFVVVSDLFLILNIPIRHVELQLVTWNRMAVFLMYTASVLLMTFTMYFWFIFALVQIKSKMTDTRRKRTILRIPVYLMIPLCVANYWTGWLFVIDEQSHYSRGSIFILQSIISYGYFLLMIIINIRHLFTKIEVESVKKVFMAILPAIICAAMQIIHGGSFLLFGTIFGGWIMYIEICLDRQKAYEMSEAVRTINDELLHSNREVAQNMRTILALSDIYYALYDVDFANDTFTEIKSIDVVTQFCEKYTSAQECLKALPTALFADEYVDSMIEFFAYDNICARLKSSTNIFVDGIGRYSESWVRAMIIASERDEDGNITHVVFTLQDVSEIVEQQKKVEEVKRVKERAADLKQLFIQTTEAMTGAIDAKDKYTHGHSVRVANYARKIAELAGMPEEECEKAYFAGLLHDVGKIGIKNSIINKEGKLTAEEYEEIKRHPVLGAQILEKITLLPYLKVGANYHHERYDGKGYPEGLKGTEIPSIARIISVADAYDAMTSRRSYRNIIPQQKVREEIVKGMGAQFDPYYAKLMVHLIDFDTDYEMRENEQIMDEYSLNEVFCEENRSKYTQGILVGDHKTRICFNCENLPVDADGMPSLVFYDSMDARVHADDDFTELLMYYEYGEIKGNGSYDFPGVRKTEITTIADDQTYKEDEIVLDAVRVDDHMYFELHGFGKVTKATLALPDSTRFVYISVTGDHCAAHDIESEQDPEPVAPDFITRIADRITYLTGNEGEIPSIQVDGWRTANTEGILLDQDMDITFEGRSLPFASMLWHCPYIAIYRSEDGTIGGPGYKEYSLVRLEGESWVDTDASEVENQIIVRMNDEFGGWESWKKESIAGRKCRVSLSIRDDQIFLNTTNGGIEIENVTSIKGEMDHIYVALSGDQCVIENIHVERHEA